LSHSDFEGETGMNPLEVVQAFVDRINAQDVEGLCALMTENHTFIDGGGAVYSGRETMKKGWQDYFVIIPNYWIKIEMMFHRDNVVGFFGKSGGTYAPGGQIEPKNSWMVPAAWRAVIHEDKVLTWQVYADNEQLRQIMTADRH